MQQERRGYVTKNYKEQFVRIEMSTQKTKGPLPASLPQLEDAIEIIMYTLK